METFNVLIIEDDSLDDYYAESPSYTKNHYTFNSNEQAQLFVKNYIYEYINANTKFGKLKHVFNIGNYVHIYNCLEQNRYNEALNNFNLISRRTISIYAAKEGLNKNITLNDKFIKYAHKHNKIEVFK